MKFAKGDIFLHPSEKTPNLYYFIKKTTIKWWDLCWVNFYNEKHHYKDHLAPKDKLNFLVTDIFRC